MIFADITPSIRLFLRIDQQSHTPEHYGLLAKIPTYTIGNDLSMQRK